jgi:hypothetical protein
VCSAQCDYATRSTTRIEQLVPIWQPCIGLSFQLWACSAQCDCATRSVCTRKLHHATNVLSPRQHRTPESMMIVALTRATHATGCDRLTRATHATGPLGGASWSTWSPTTGALPNISRTPNQRLSSTARQVDCPHGQRPNDGGRRGPGTAGPARTAGRGAAGGSI